MKKLLIGLGIGCGVLVVVGILVVVAGGFWLKRKAGAKLDSLKQAGVEMKLQEEALKQLDSDFPFSPPPEGELMKLDEARLQEYIAIRKEALPVYKEYEEKSKAFDTRTSKGKDVGIGDVMEGMGMVTGFMMKLRTTFISSLRAHRMSPREFHTTTATVYSTYMHKGMQAAGQATDEAREKIQKEMGELNDRMNEPGLTEDAKAAIQNAIDELQKSLDSLPASSGGAGAGGAVTDANAALLEKYKADVELAANPAFDIFIANDDMSKAFNNAFSAPSR
jgi:hypothetical protein